MKILITGASGGLGQKIVRGLLNNDHTVNILSRQEKKYLFDFSEIKSSIGDLCNVESLSLATKNIELIIHLAAVTHTNNTKMYYDINVQGTINLIKAAEKNMVKKIIYISSRTASPEGGAYANSKYLAEKSVMNSSINWIIFRPAEIYGVKDGEAISQLVKIVRKYFLIPVIGNGEYTLAPVYVDDVVRAIIEAVKKDFNKKIYTLAGPNVYSYNELIDIIKDTFNIRRINVYIPIFIFKIVAWINSIIGFNFFVKDQLPRLVCAKSADIESARKDLKFNPISFDKGVRNHFNN